MKRMTTARSIFWAGGVGIYLAGRIILLNFLKAFAFVGIAASLHFTFPLEALNWVKVMQVQKDDR